ncbi:hypothetical protein LWI29_025144 [Acer saccharum]|uniref:Uncharacterized protein n=1 Tax=Acer saccharum TaxID=4024 RepID=A0AA39VRB0_ACESA|nr:hypothetical protein LWI29_025144 [Acer saccharum]
MVDLWWSLLGVAIPVVIMGQALRMKKRITDEQRLKGESGREKSSDDVFVCERVYTSKRMLKKMSELKKKSKDRTEPAREKTTKNGRHGENCSVDVIVRFL